MIIPTLPIDIRFVQGRDAYGQPKLSAPHRELCAPVRLDFRSMNSTVRTDSGATHGHAHEDAHVAVLLVRPGSKADTLDAIIEIMGQKLKVEKIHPRYTSAGKLDHLQLECGPWA